MNDDNAAEWLAFDVIVHRHWVIGETLCGETTYTRPAAAANDG